MITIGKYSLEYHGDTSDPGEDHASFDGTMVLNTKQQKELLLITTARSASWSKNTAARYWSGWRTRKPRSFDWSAR